LAWRPSLSQAIDHAVFVSIGRRWLHLVSFVFGGTASPAKLADGQGGQSARCRRASADLKMLTEQQTPDLGKPPFEAITGPWLWREPRTSNLLRIILSVIKNSPALRCGSAHSVTKVECL
jgi:hypothetical protein